MSMSSENRSISFHPFDNDVPPLKVRWLPSLGRVKSSRKIQQTQKSFSTLDASSPIRSPANSQSCWRRSLDRFRKLSMVDLGIGFGDFPHYVGYPSRCVSKISDKLLL